MVQQTSITAYESIKEELGNRQKMVYETIKKLGEADNLTISQYLKIPINSTTPRTKELRDKKLVGVSRVGIGSTGRPVIFWKIVRKH